MILLDLPLENLKCKKRIFCSPLAGKFADDFVLQINMIIIKAKVFAPYILVPSLQIWIGAN